MAKGSAKSLQAVRRPEHLVRETLRQDAHTQSSFALAQGANGRNQNAREMRKRSEGWRH